MRGEVRLDALEAVADERIDGARYRRRRLPLPLALPQGYHRLEVTAGGGAPAAMALTVVPERAFGPADLGRERLWGVTLPLYGLSSERNWGIGDFGDLAELATATAGLGAALIGINPVHALLPSVPERISPYAPSSRRFLNVLLISIERAARRLGGLPELDPGRRALLARRAGRGAGRLSGGLGAEARGRSRTCIAPVARSAGPQRTAFEQLPGARADRASSARRSSRRCWSTSPATTRKDRSWRDWPADYRRPDGRAVAAFADRHAGPGRVLPVSPMAGR